MIAAQGTKWQKKGGLAAALRVYGPLPSTASLRMESSLFLVTSCVAPFRELQCPYLISTIIGARKKSSKTPKI